jgi:hypothetical protein
MPDQEDSEMALAQFVCDELHWAVRETLRACDEEELTLPGGASAERCVPCTSRSTWQPRFAMRADGGLEGKARDLARDRGLVARTFEPLRQGENMSVTTSPTESMVRRPRLHGRVAFVTGGTRGIGLRMALADLLCFC